jgi:pimeloyl-ACP methyl ester carboxylesterase
MTLDTQEKYLTLDALGQKVEIRYLDAGIGETLVLVHGVGSCLEVWSKNIPELAKSFRVIALDMPGHGKSTRLDDSNLYTTKNMAEVLYQFIKAINLPQKPVIAGHSVGAIICLSLIIDHQDIGDKLILISPGGLGSSIGGKFRLATIFPLGEIAFSWIGIEITKLIAYSRLPKNELIDKPFLDSLFRYMQQKGSSDAIVKSLRYEANIHGLKNPYTKNQLASIKIPTLVMWGSADKSVPAIYAEVAATNIPNSRVIVFEGAKHRSQVSYSTKVNEFIKTFSLEGKLDEVIEQYAASKQIYNVLAEYKEF